MDYPVNTRGMLLGFRWGLLLAGIALALVVVASADSVSKNRSGQEDQAGSYLPASHDQPHVPARDFLLRSPVAGGGLARPAIRGKVTDASGLALSGVEVYAHVIPDGGHAPATGYLPPPPEVVTATDGAGRFDMALPWRAVAYKVDLGAASPRHVRQLRQDLVVAEDHVLEVNFVLEDGLAIEGILMDQAGSFIQEPIELKATIRPSPATERISQFRVDSTNKRLAERHRQHYHEARTTSRQDGTFVFRGLPPGEFQIEVAAGPWLVTPLAMAVAGATGVHVRMSYAERLRFHAFDGSRPGANNQVPFELVATIATSGDLEDRFSVVTMVSGGFIELAWKATPRDSQGWKCDYELAIQGYPLVRNSISRPGAGVIPAVEIDVANLQRDLFPVSITAWHSDGTEIGSDLQLLYAVTESSSHSAVELHKINEFTYAALLPKGDYFVRVSEVSPFAYGTAYRGEIKVGETGGGILDARILRGGQVTVYGEPGPFQGVGASFGCALTIGSEGFTVFPNVPPGMWQFMQGSRRAEVVVQANGKHVVQL